MSEPVDYVEQALITRLDRLVEEFRRRAKRLERGNPKARPTPRVLRGWATACWSAARRLERRTR